MAAKVTQQDIDDAGFRAEQFGIASGGAAAWSEYVARLLARAELWSRGRFGDGYAAVPTDTPQFEHLRAAELCWASAQLWKRRAAFIDSNAVSSLERLAHADRREFEAQAERAMACAEEQMALAINPAAPAGTGGTLTHVVTGPRPALGVVR